MTIAHHGVALWAELASEWFHRAFLVEKYRSPTTRSGNGQRPLPHCALHKICWRSIGCSVMVLVGWPRPQCLFDFCIYEGIWLRLMVDDPLILHWSKSNNTAVKSCSILIKSAWCSTKITKESTINRFPGKVAVIIPSLLFWSSATASLEESRFVCSVEIKSIQRQISQISQSNLPQGINLCLTSFDSEEDHHACEEKFLSLSLPHRRWNDSLMNEAVG